MTSSEHNKYRLEPMSPKEKDDLSKFKSRYMFSAEIREMAQRVAYNSLGDTKAFIALSSIKPFGAQCEFDFFTRKPRIIFIFRRTFELIHVCFDGETFTIFEDRDLAHQLFGLPEVDPVLAVRPPFKLSQTEKGTKNTTNWDKPQKKETAAKPFSQQPTVEDIKKEANRVIKTPTVPVTLDTIVNKARAHERDVRSDHMFTYSPPGSHTVEDNYGEKTEKVAIWEFLARARERILKRIMGG